MNYGASIACFYPMDTELSLRKIGELGVKNTEIFFNTFSELEIDYLKNLRRIADEYGVSIGSIHPFSSFAENYMLFTSYERRFQDTAEMYKRYYEACNILGAGITVFHGARDKASVCDEMKFERFGIMSEQAKQNGVILAQENVVEFCSQHPDFLIRMRDYLGDKFKMVLDSKQAIRANHNPMEFVDALGESIVHIHISDSDSKHDCLAPGRGTYDLKGLKNAMKKLNYHGNWIVELYNHSYSGDDELIRGVEYIASL
ncbi:MAG: sugar phosphate isomerase/epimerase [Clostridia bacterium]|nr:sugar phosphate isomerase/epimerase [Clostridia bacterium]